MKVNIYKVLNKAMLLAIDIGNTHVDLGLFRAEKLHAHSKLCNRGDADIETYREDMRSFLTLHLNDERVEVALVGSVVSGLGSIFTTLCRALDMDTYQVDSYWDLGLHINYDHPQRVGIDRLLAAAAAFARAPEGHGAIVADCGTAITVDAVNAQGVFLGGAIAPGLHLMLDALRSGTSLLPTVELGATPPLLGQTTPDCMRSGALHGGAALVDGLCQRISNKLDIPTKKWLTGGDARRLEALTHHFDHCEPTLVLCGLALAHQRRLLTL